MTWMTAGELIAELQRVPTDTPVLITTNPREYPGHEVPANAVDLSHVLVRYAMSQR